MRPTLARVLLCGGMLLVPLAAHPAAASGEPGERVMAAPGRLAWQPMAFPSIDRKTRYETVDLEDGPALRARSECSASALVLPLEDVDLARTPRLRWRWKVEEAMAAHDERVKSGDDFAARVYVMFPFEPERASLWERARRRAARAVFGEEIPGGAINYVWSSREPFFGRRWDNPYHGASKMLSLGTGALTEWRSEDVDIAADYRALFGGEPPAPTALAVMTDSDDTCGRAAAWFADFRFAPESP